MKFCLLYHKWPEMNPANVLSSIFYLKLVFGFPFQLSAQCNRSNQLTINFSLCHINKPRRLLWVSKDNFIRMLAKAVFFLLRNNKTLRFGSFCSLFESVLAAFFKVYLRWMFSYIILSAKMSIMCLYFVVLFVFGASVCLLGVILI